MADMKRCKECGKLFMPKGRESYCTDIHYRPCPVCGDPVEAKYLSDPPRRCANCRGKSVPIKPVPSKPIEPIETVVSTTGPQKKSETKPVSMQLFKLNSLTKLVSQDSKPNPKLAEIKAKEQTLKPEPNLSGYIHPDVKLDASWDVREYVGKQFKNNFETGHVYAIDIDKDRFGCYCISAVFDLTLNAYSDNYLPLSSTISIDQNFKKIEVTN